MKKLLRINAVMVAVLFMVAVVPNYYINYQVYVSVMDSLAGFEWLTFLGILTAGALVSALFACIKFKNISYKRRFLGASFLFNLAFFLFISYHGTLAVLSAKRQSDALLSEYKTKAESDMKNGLIVYETAGLPISSGRAEQIKGHKIDSLMKTYGLESRNTGCMVTAPLLKAQSEYERLTEPFLDLRNGPGWKHRMKLQIENIRKGQF
ncbi:hypothetical protein [Dyadobacter sp. SG02]|uniref:FEKKY domain-containing protein n=1 Tax=Dyadobacter sp. SG02 TaxID=1855291 RepID=UPI00115F7FC6|nr:hypothetical protein [Dyadobacter sp. SG02]